MQERKNTQTVSMHYLYLLGHAQPFISTCKSELKGTEKKYLRQMLVSHATLN